MDRRRRGGGCRHRRPLRRRRRGRLHEAIFRDAKDVHVAPPPLGDGDEAAVVVVIQLAENMHRGADDETIVHRLGEELVHDRDLVDAVSALVLRLDP